MDTNYIRTLFEYDRWANNRMLAAAAKLTEEQFTKNLGNSFASVRDTLAHILGAERVWLSRWQGNSLTSPVDLKQFADVDALRKAWAVLQGEMGAFLNSLTDGQLQSLLSYKMFSGQPQSQPLWQQMAHLANHSSYHRGQVTTLLRQLGAQPVGTDLITFFREQNQSAT